MIFKNIDHNKIRETNSSRVPKTIKNTFLCIGFLGLFSITLSFKTEPKSKKLALWSVVENIKTNIDSMHISIPCSVNFSALTEEYKLHKSFVIEDFYNKNIASSTFSGSFLVAKNGVVLYEKYSGYSNFKEKIAFEKQTPTHVASVSKVLTSAAIMRLVHFEKINLDTLVQFYLPEFPYKDITVRHLLNHRSGLQHYSRFPEFVKGWNYKKTLTNQDVLKYFEKYNFKKVFKTDTKFNYNNANYALLALIIEKTTEKSFIEAMSELVFEPLEMNDSFVIDFELQKNEVCQSYKSNGVNYGWDQFDGIVGDKNVYTTARDLLKFDMATYSDEFLPSNLKEEMLKGYSYEANGNNNYGLGIRMKAFENGQKIHYHNGWWHGNTSSYVSLKNDTVTIISLSNRFSKKPYSVMRLSSIFGEYPYNL